MVIDNRQARTLRLNQSTVGVRATPWVDGSSQARIGYFAILAA
jgi:hypothetical protein